MIVCALLSIQTKPLPLDIQHIRSATPLTPAEILAETQYRASLSFSIDNGPRITFTLYTTPVFISLPPCRGVPHHQIHVRVTEKLQRNWWEIKDLKDATPEEYDDQGLMVINATGQGAECLARAWCSETGKNALVVRRERGDGGRGGGPCFACAHRAAGAGEKGGLGEGVLIWY